MTIRGYQGGGGVRLLDLFCGAGGAAMGYSRAGFTEIVGVDIKPQPRYPFEFVQADWEEPLSYLPGLWEREGVSYVVHASPPCQRYSNMTKKWGREEDHPDLVAAVREAIAEIEPPAYVIENVPGAPLEAPVMLCGSMFGLGAFVCGCGLCVANGDRYGCANCNGDDGATGRIYQLFRHRMFETDAEVFAPAMCAHERQALPVYGHAGGRSKRDGLKFPGTDAWREGMGIDWMTGAELAEAIPPAYTEYIGRRLLEQMELDR